MPSSTATCQPNPEAILRDRRVLEQHGCAVRVEPDGDRLCLLQWPLDTRGVMVENEECLVEFLDLDEQLAFWNAVDSVFQTTFALAHQLRVLGTTEAALPVFRGCPYRFADDCRTWQGRDGVGWQHTLHRDGIPVAQIHQDGVGGQTDIRSLRYDVPGKETVDQVTNDFEDLAQKLPPNAPIPGLEGLPHSWDSALTLLSVLCQLHLLD